MDPHYRTMQGFAKLVEKEWIGFGHMFAKRNGTGSNRTNPGDKNRSPIFLQWLDCIYQLIEQFPSCFQFNGHLLAFLADAVNSCLYGNFLFDSEKERVEKRVRHNTCSLWPAVFRNKGFYNPFYIGEQRDTYYLIPSASPTEFSLFLPFYSRWDPFAAARAISMGNDAMQPITRTMNQNMNDYRVSASHLISASSLQDDTERHHNDLRSLDSLKTEKRATRSRKADLKQTIHMNAQNASRPRASPSSVLIQQENERFGRECKRSPPVGHSLAHQKIASANHKGNAVPSEPLVSKKFGETRNIAYGRGNLIRARPVSSNGPANTAEGSTPPPPPPERRKKTPKKKNLAKPPKGATLPPPLLSRSVKDLGARLKPFIQKRRSSVSAKVISPPAGRTRR